MDEFVHVMPGQIDGRVIAENAGTPFLIDRIVCVEGSVVAIDDLVDDAVAVFIHVRGEFVRFFHQR